MNFKSKNAISIILLININHLYQFETSTLGHYCDNMIFQLPDYSKNPFSLKTNKGYRPIYKIFPFRTQFIFNIICAGLPSYYNTNRHLIHQLFIFCESTFNQLNLRRTFHFFHVVMNG